MRVAINGFGRIGRAFFKASLLKPEIEIVAINDLGDAENLAYLLKYDSVYGPSGLDVEMRSGKLVIEGKEILFLSEKEPSKLPWKEQKIDVVVESTGVFDSYEKASAHIKAGARKVVITAPVKDEAPAGITGATVLMGINDDKLKTCQISSNASCTTNAGSPVLAIMNESLGVKKAMLNTVHGYTASQSIVDSPAKKDFRRGRAAGVNIVPSSTGAAVSTTKALTDLQNKFDGIALRVPVLCGSIVDITFLAGKETSAEEVNGIMKKAAEEERWRGIFSVTEEELVSADIIGNPHASIADLKLTRVVGGDLVKIMAWYDNEIGYSNVLAEHVIKAGSV